jgi:hypothetical protein
MPTIEITEEQRDRLENVRAELEEHRLGPYGVVRTVDAVEFLLDHYERGVGLAEDASEDGREAADAGTDGVDGNQEEAQEDGNEEGEAKANEPEEDGDDDEVEEDGDEDEVEENGKEAEEDGDEDEVEEDEKEAKEDGDDGEVEEDETEAEEDGDDGEVEEDETEAEEDGSEGSSGRLNMMMQLLEEHDDKWEEDPDAEGGKYAVSLPDGVTENVRTKDDVRALLFKHY